MASGTQNLGNLWLDSDRVQGSPARNANSRSGKIRMGSWGSSAGTLCPRIWQEGNRPQGPKDKG